MMEMNKILVGFDGSPSSKKALEYAKGSKLNSTVMAPLYACRISAQVWMKLAKSWTRRRNELSLCIKKLQN
jgi:nucleotide-binding universal stress UspA family protein